MNTMTMAYTNQRTGETEYLAATPQDWSDYIPQNEAAQALYRLYQETGDAPIEAAKKVLEFVVSVHDRKE